VSGPLTAPVTAPAPVAVWTSEGEDVRVGALYPHRRRGTESATFSYDDAYLARPDAYAIDPQLSLDASPHHTSASRALFGAMADGAPDRWGRTLLTRREARAARDERRAARALGELDFLLGVRDDLRQGALRYLDEKGEFLAREPDGVPVLTDLPSLLDLADRAERDSTSLPDLQRLVHAGGSLGGARPKAHVIARDGTLALAKFPSAERDTWDVMAWEYVTARLAEAAGIVVPACELLTLAERRVLLVNRFDRRYSAGVTRRVGYASAMTMLEASEGDGASYLDIAAVIEVRSDRATADLEQLWRRALFSVLVGNTDDHLRNHGFLHVPGRDAWRLSPAFDMNPDPTPGPKHHATSVDGTDAAATVEAVLAVAPEFRLRPTEADVVAGTVMGAVSRWREVARSAGLTGGAIKAMAPAFEALPIGA
jgi:serine/threonine-protein kinase HipA